MTPLYLYQNKILKTNSGLASDAGCCCGGSCCAYDVLGQYQFSGSVTEGAITTNFSGTLNNGIGTFDETSPEGSILSTDCTSWHDNCTYPETQCVVAAIIQLAFALSYEATIGIYIADCGSDDINKWLSEKNCATAISIAGTYDLKKTCPDTTTYGTITLTEN